VAPGDLRPLGRDDLAAIAALCSRSLRDAPATDELARSLFAPEQPTTLLGDPDVGLVGTCAGTGAIGTADQGFVRILVVAPEHRGRGTGRALLAAAENDLRARGLGSVGIGADAPYYLWPGVEASETATHCLLERRRYTRTNANFNMDVDLTAIPADPGGWTVATAAERDELGSWAARHWGFWEAELRRALGRGTLVLARDDDGIAAVCAYDVNRDGWVGPVAVRPDRLGRGVGVAPLLGALHRMRADGRSRAEVAWVGPVVPYARVGGTIGRVFFTYRKELS
jgi:GNAT superfamily N-acetyltransferase